MSFLYQKVSIVLLFVCSVIFVNAQTDSLENYINRLRLSQASGGSETAFLSTGSDFLYGQDYFEAGNYSSAASYFQAIIRKEKNHPYANYQLAISLLKQNDPEKAKLAKILLANSFKTLPALKERYQKDMPEETVMEEPKSNKAAEPKPNPAPAQKPAAEKKKGLDAYIEEIKYSRSTGGAATTMLAPGLDAFYGIEYFEKGEFRSAETDFSLSLSKDPNNPYVNYLKVVSMAAQGKTEEAKPFLAKATAGDVSIKNRFTTDAAASTEKWNQKI
jgi:tetratricopeptide (TPR) repeat protein